MNARRGTHAWWTAAVVACCLGYVSLGFAEARRVGLIYTWRNELNTDVATQELIQASVPDTNTPVKGFFYLGSHGGCPGADNRAWARGEGDGKEMMQFAKEFGWGLMATSHMCGSEYNMKNTNLLLKALEEFSDLGTNPEIENVPLIPLGGSNAGATAYSLTNTIPHKILCVTPGCCAGFNPNPPTADAIKVPGIFGVGENDFNRNNHNTIIGGSRARGSLWSWFEVKGMGHEYWRISHLYRPFWEKCIALRYPDNYNPRIDGPVQLKPIAENSGWLASTDWRTDIITIDTFPAYSGSQSAAMWLLDRDIATIFRSEVHWFTDPTLDLEVNGMLAEWTIPGDPWTVVQPGTEATLRVTAGSFAWNRIEFFHGASKIGEVTSGAPELTFTLPAQPLAQTYVAAVHSSSSTRYPLPINVGVIADAVPVANPAVATATPRTAIAMRNAVVYDLTGRRLSPAGSATGVRFLTDARCTNAVVRVR